MNIVVASGDAGQLELLESGATLVGQQMRPRVPVTIRSVASMQDARKRIDRETALLVIASSWTGTVETDPGLDLIKSLASKPSSPACILVGRLELLLSVQPIKRCELLVVDCTTDYVRQCVILARRLDVIQDESREVRFEDDAFRTTHSAIAETSGPRKEPSFAILEVDLRRDIIYSRVHLNIHKPTGVLRREPEPLVLKEDELVEFIRDSKNLKKNLAKWHQNASRRGHYTKWHAEYRQLGERVSRMLWGSRAFNRYYDFAQEATRDKDVAPQGHVRLRFNLEQPWFDGLWEAIADEQDGRHLILDNTVARRYLLPNKIDAFGSRDGQIETDDGNLNVLVLRSHVPAGSVPDGPNDGLWRKYWKSYNGVLPALPHLDQEVDEIRKLEKSKQKNESRATIKINVTVLPKKDAAAGEAWSLVDELKEHLTNGSRRYDVVHFAGHALFADGIDGDERGYLIFSGFPNPRAVPIAAVAPLLKEANVQLVYLSCCRSSASAAALEFSRNDIPMTIGFHWDLDDSKAPVFAKEFYRELLENDLRVCRATSKARKSLFVEHDKGDPIWASPVLIAQPMDWLQVEGVLKLSAHRSQVA
ncbi:CHAT domain-containing protein [Bradyrhizobium quebecense]|uniref:CHAT domain-containing protein n=1 Tax=Bradyrhizobium quebecense TaxID=2748629 RepID=A0A974AFX4_9BRAD|nr:CHAT domain-containing protein [Bradyrhizobium quebecense]UGA43469.1 CHAT domain-containing protein [Bradyrhizobium quebecense]